MRNGFGSGWRTNSRTRTHKGVSQMLKSIRRGHRYLVFHAYLYQKYLGTSMPKLAASIQMAGAIFINLLLIAIVTHTLIGTWIPPMGLGPWGGVGFMFLIVVMEYWSQMAKGRFERIQREFEGQSNDMERRGRKVLLLYCFGSVLLVILIPILMTL